MDKINSLKKESSIDNSDPRFTPIEYIEYVSKQILYSIREYLQDNNEAPKKILIHSEKYASGVCFAKIQKELNFRGLSSEMNYSSNGKVADKGDLEFNLDEMVEEYHNVLEFASRQMIHTLRSYLEVNDIGPERILVKSKKHSFSLSFNMLSEEILSKGLTTRLYHSSVVKNPTEKDLVLDLDEIVERDVPGSLYRDEILR